MLRKVLIVDDEKINRKILNSILKDEYEVLEADNGKIALRILQDKYDTISAVLLDILMPVMNGYDFLSKMRSIETLVNIPVLVTTSSSEIQDEIQALSLGANDFITKPYNAPIIKHRLRNIISLRERAALISSIQNDPLTGLYNRETFFSRAESMILAHESGYFVMACLDVNNFKVINDQYGSAVGDEVLKHIAARLGSIDGIEEALSSRIMADKFALLYPGEFLDSEILAGIRREVMQFHESMHPISIRIGRYVVDDCTLSGSAMFDRASIAADSIKDRSDIQTVMFDNCMRENILREQEIVDGMNNALSAQEFEIWMQPQYNHATGELIGSEALVRWRHPQKGIIPPNRFIPVFERNGFIYELDKYVWEQTCIFLSERISQGVNPLPVSVNISRIDIYREDFLETITGLVSKYQIPCDLFRLEITESAFLKSTAVLVNIVNQLVDYGFVIEIDDFGSGYSSLNTLKNIPADILKLDMRFLENDDDSRRGDKILESIIRMAKWLGMSVIAEGVETKMQADFLNSIGCCFIQGYYYAKPMSLTEYHQLTLNYRKAT